MSTPEVCALGFGTVFVGLIALILIISLMGVIVRKFEKKQPEKAAEAAKPAAQGDGIANRQEFVAAVSAAIATVMGTDVSGLRIKSIKKM